MIWDAGHTVVIPVYRNDAWGEGLSDAVEDRFTDLGGIFLDEIAYEIDVVEFTGEASQLSSTVSNAITTYGASNVAVLLIAFEESELLMTAADAYPQLKTVTWFGSDGTALAGALIENEDVAAFATDVGFLNTIFAPTHSPKWEALRAHNLAEVGREPDSYSYAVHDVVWTYAMSILAAGDTDPDKIIEVLPTVTESLFGASGWVQLDEAGDRTTSNYDIWQIVESTPGNYTWAHAGVWNTALDTITWDD
jgi:branched-chain amino acid transport system substrate-binding protein